MEVIVKAEKIEYEFDLKQLNETTIRVICVCNDIIYNKTIFSNDEWWLNNKKYFQDSFEEFIKILNFALIENNQSFNINVIPEYLDKLNIVIKYNSSFFNFEISIDVQREPTLEEKFEKLEEEFKTLVKRFKLIELENINLKEKITKIENEVNDEEWHVFPYKNCCIKPEQTGKILDFTTIDNAKQYCIQKQYGCFVLFKGKVYFRKSSYQESMDDVKLTHNDDSNCTTYIPVCQKESKLSNMCLSLDKFENYTKSEIVKFLQENLSTELLKKYKLNGNIKPISKKISKEELFETYNNIIKNDEINFSNKEFDIKRLYSEDDY